MVKTLKRLFWKRYWLCEDLYGLAEWVVVTRTPRPPYAMSPVIVRKLA